MPMHNPAHPGEILKNYVGERSITEVALHLGVTRVALSRVLNGQAGISAEMALRVGKLFNTDPEFWLKLQSQRDLWVASKTPPRVILFPRMHDRTTAARKKKA